MSIFIYLAVSFPLAQVIRTYQSRLQAQKVPGKNEGFHGDFINGAGQIYIYINI